MIVTTKELFGQAYGKYAIGAYNINNAEQTMGLFKGNMDSKAPFIIQISKGARSYTNKLMLEGMIRAADEIFPDAVFAVHLDHGDEATCYDCIESGFYSSVMIDASHESFDDNIATTKRVVDKAHAKGISVEAELGQLGGVEEDISVAEDKAHLTDPKQAAEFIKRSGCDSLACAIGTSHGAFKFSGGQALHFEVVEEIQKLVPGYPLAFNGSPADPANWHGMAHVLGLPDVSFLCLPDLADAALIWLADASGQIRILTVDARDFSVYRLKRGRRFEQIAWC